MSNALVSQTASKCCSCILQLYSSNNKVEILSIMSCCLWKGVVKTIKKVFKPKPYLQPQSQVKPHHLHPTCFTLPVVFISGTHSHDLGCKPFSSYCSAFTRPLSFLTPSSLLPSSHSAFQYSSQFSRNPNTLLLFLHVYITFYTFTLFLVHSPLATPDIKLKPEGKASPIDVSHRDLLIKSMVHLISTY